MLEFSFVFQTKDKKQNPPLLIYSCIYNLLVGDVRGALYRCPALRPLGKGTVPRDHPATAAGLHLPHQVQSGKRRCLSQARDTFAPAEQAY